MNNEEFIKKLNEKYADEHFKILHIGQNSTDNSAFKCLDCGCRIEIKNGELFRTRRQHICSKCYYKRKDTIANEEIIKKQLSDELDINFFMEGHKGIRHHMVSYTCHKCGRINTRRVSNLLRQKEICGFCSGHKQSKDNDTFLCELHEKSGEKFSLLTEYVNAKTKIRVRCNECGFIRDLKPNTLLSSCFCPKCNKKSSRGETKIVKFLQQNNIVFIPQMYFSNWGIGIHYFDFYIPEYNLVLEFHGRQHYEFVEFFHKTEENFKYRLEKDIKKRDTAISQGCNYVSINYHLINDIDFILTKLFNSTTIPVGSRGKCFEIETIQDIG